MPSAHVGKRGAQFGQAPWPWLIQKSAGSLFVEIQVDPNFEHGFGRCWETEEYDVDDEDDLQELRKAHNCDLLYTRSYLRLFEMQQKSMELEKRMGYEPSPDSGRYLPSRSVAERMASILVQDLSCNLDRAVRPAPGARHAAFAARAAPCATRLACLAQVERGDPLPSTSSDPWLTRNGSCCVDTLPLALTRQAVDSNWLEGVTFLVQYSTWDPLSEEGDTRGAEDRVGQAGLAERFMEMLFQRATIHQAARSRHHEILEYLLGPVDRPTSRDFLHQGKPVSQMLRPDQWIGVPPKYP